MRDSILEEREEDEGIEEEEEDSPSSQNDRTNAYVKVVYYSAGLNYYGY